MKNYICFIAATIFAASAASAEHASYGNVDLTGLSRTNSWPLNDFAIHNTMVCNVNGPDGYLSVRSGPGSNYEQVRAFNRLAILVVDTTQRSGNWIRVVGASRTHTVDGAPQDYKDLPVTGWAHDGYLCDFLD